MAVSPSDGPTIHAYFFDSPGCVQCEPARELVERYLEPDPQVELSVVSVHEPEAYELGLALITVSGAPDDAVPTAPGLIMGETYLDIVTLQERELLRALDRYRETGAPSLMEAAERIKGRARYSLPARFRGFGVLTIIGAGLIDGVNPCAFATLVFFLAYLGTIGARAQSILATGLAFATGVYVAYFAFGLGLLHTVFALESFPAVRSALYVVIGVGCLALACISFHDVGKARAGQTSAVILQLPGAVKRQAHAVIRKGVRARTLLLGGLCIGGAVSLLELACTGQVYLPAIVYMTSISETRVAAMGWLALYDLCFVVPLLGILGLAATGQSSRRLAEWAESRVAFTKTLMGVFFVLAAAYFVLRSAGLL